VGEAVGSAVARQVGGYEDGFAGDLSVDEVFFPKVPAVWEAVEEDDQAGFAGNSRWRDRTDVVELRVAITNIAEVMIEVVWFLGEIPDLIAIYPRSDRSQSIDLKGLTQGELLFVIGSQLAKASFSSHRHQRHGH